MRSFDCRHGRNEGGLRRNRLDRVYGGQEAISAPGLRFDESRRISRVAQRLPQFLHGTVQALVEIDKRILVPESLAQPLAGNNFARLFQQQHQDQKWFFPELDADAVLA